MYPFWWAAGVRVVGMDGRTGMVSPSGDGWLVQLDRNTDAADYTYVVQPDPGKWAPEIRQTVSPSQLDRIAHDAERALLRAFGIHYVPEYESLTDGARPGARPHVVGRVELAGLQAVIYGAVKAALRPYTTGV